MLFVVFTLLCFFLEYDYKYEIFQVLGLVDAEAETDVLDQLKKDYPYLKGSGYKEVWIYQLVNKTPTITNLVLDGSQQLFNNQQELEIVNKIFSKLHELNAFTDVQLDFIDGNSYYFLGFSDALQEIRIDLHESIISVYDRYITEKHFVHFGDYQLL